MTLRWLSKAMVMAAVFAMLAGGAGAQVVLDLDDAPGDQGVREAEAAPGKTVKVEVIAASEMKGVMGFELVLKFDPAHASIRFSADGLFSGGFAIPANMPDGATVSVALGGTGAEEDGGLLGYLRIKTTDQAPRELKIDLVRATLGSVDGTKRTVELSGGVKLINPKAPEGPASSDGPPQGPTPTGGPGQQKPDDKPMGPPGQQKPGDRPMSPPGQQKPGDRPMGPPGQPPGQGPMGGPDMGHQPEMSPEDAIKKLPEGLQEPFKQTLRARKDAHRKHLEAELQVQKSVRTTLEETKKFLEKASDADRQTVMEVLGTFKRMMPDHPEEPMPGPGGGPMPPGGGGPMPPGGGGPTPPAGGGPKPPPGNMGGGQAGPNLDQMIRKVDDRIAELNRELQEMGI